MTHKEIINACKFYHGEGKNPYPDRSSNGLLWRAEQYFVNITSDPYTLKWWKSLMSDTAQVTSDTFLHDAELADAQKTILFFINSWLGRMRERSDERIELWITTRSTS